MSCEQYVYTKDFLLERHSLTYDEPSDFIKIQWATLKTPAPPVNLMNDDQLESFNYDVDLPDVIEDYTAKRTFIQKGRGTTKGRGMKHDGNRGYNNNKNEIKTQSTSWRRDKKPEETIKKTEPTTKTKAENRDTHKSPWNIETNPWSSLQEIVENEDKKRSVSPNTTKENITTQQLSATNEKFITFLQNKQGIHDFKKLITDDVVSSLERVDLIIEDIDFSTFKYEVSDVEEKTWYYKDPKNIIQGPFNGIEMNTWLLRGYFKPDLMVRKNESDNFYTLGFLFLSSLKNCFTGAPLLEFLEQLLSTNIFKVMVLDYLSQVFRNMPLRESKQEVKKLPTDKDTKSTLNKTIKNQNTTTQSFDYLDTPKTQQKEKARTPSLSEIQQEELGKKNQTKTKAESKPSVNPKTSVEPKTSIKPKKVPSLYEIQQEELRRKELEKNKKVSSKPEPVKKTIVSAWGSNANSSERIKSLKEIQDEELSKKSSQPKFVSESTGPTTKPLLAWGRPPTIKSNLSLLEIQQQELQKSKGSDTTSDDNFWDYKDE